MNSAESVPLGVVWPSGMAPERVSVPVGHTPYSWHHSGESPTPPGHTVFSWGEPTSVSSEPPATEPDEAGRRLAALLQELADCDARLSALEAKDNATTAKKADSAAPPAFFPPETQWLRFGNCSATVAPGSQLDSAMDAANNAKAPLRSNASPQSAPAEPELKSMQPEKAAPPEPQPEPEPQTEPEEKSTPQPHSEPQPALPEQAAPQPTPEPAPEPKSDLVWVEDGAFVGCMECNAEFWFFRWRHHCRGCGRLLCDSCSTARIGFETVITAAGVQQGAPGETHRACKNCVAGRRSTLT